MKRQWETRLQKQKRESWGKKRGTEPERAEGKEIKRDEVVWMTLVSWTRMSPSLARCPSWEYTDRCTHWQKIGGKRRQQLVSQWRATAIYWPTVRSMMRGSLDDPQQDCTNLTKNETHKNSVVFLNCINILFFFHMMWNVSAGKSTESMWNSTWSSIDFCL